MKATEDRVKAEEEAAKEAIVEKKKAKEFRMFSTNFLRRKRMKESITRTCVRARSNGIRLTWARRSFPVKKVKDIHTLAPDTWLNDECVNFTLGILGSRTF